jgi:hypothetical protein
MGISNLESDAIVANCHGHKKQFRKELLSVEEIEKYYKYNQINSFCKS